MRHRDCPTVEEEIRVVADPAAIWAVVTDIELPVRRSPELRRVEWLDGATAVAVGSRFRGSNRNERLGEWETECVVTEVDVERRWTWDVCGPAGVQATWGFEIDPGRDAVTVRQWARLRTGQSGMTVAIEAMPDKEGRIIARRLAQWRNDLAANLELVRELVEGAEPPVPGPDPAVVSW